MVHPREKKGGSPAAKMIIAQLTLISTKRKIRLDLKEERNELSCEL